MPFSMSLAELILCADTLAAGRDSWKKALLAARHSVWQHLSLMVAIRCNRRYFVAAIADFPVLQNALEKAGCCSGLDLNSQTLIASSLFGMSDSARSVLAANSGFAEIGIPTAQRSAF